MGKTNFEIIISKYLQNEASTAEMDALAKWLEHGDNYKVFKDYVKVHHTLNKDRIFDGIVAYNETLKVKPLYKKPVFKYAVAASIALFISLTFIFNEEKSSINNPATAINKIKPGTDKAILTLEDGSDVTLEKNQHYVSDKVESNGKDIIYRSDGSTNSKITYNYLTIPRKGQYHVVLSDGTEVWINSESQLKYPVAFTKGAKRKVELVYGEAYFDVSPSSNHNGAKFIVTTKNQEIEVIGTEFNIKAYNDEDIIYTTLVEGKINIEVNASKEVLNPDQQFVLNKNNNDFIITQVDTYSETAWTKGLFSFKNKSLKDIMKVMSRWYDVDVVFENKSLEHIQFKGVISKNQNIEDILTLIKNTNFINAYDIKNSTILLK